MLSVKNNVIHLTRGDTAYLDVEISGYMPKAGDIVKFSVKKKVEDTDYIIQKELIPNEQIKLEPQDTKDLEYGKYLYDVELQTADGDIFTFIGPVGFYLTEEITNG